MENHEITQAPVAKIINIPTYAKIKVYWDDKPENYSRESRNKVKKYFANKYNIPPNQVNVIYRPVRINSKTGELIKIEGGTIDNILNTTYQRELFKEWLLREGKDVDFSRLVALDNKVNAELDIDVDNKTHRKYRLSWLKINNFLSYGEDNFFPVDRYRGFTVINSEPANQGGKTTLSIDSVKFLFFGKTTKTDKNEEIFNQFTDKDELKVRGMLDIEGEESVIIERHLKRKAKRAGGWNIDNTLTYYRILPDGEEEELDEADATATTALIKETVGSEDDFELVALATFKNLDTLIDSTTTESGKLLTRFIGLEVIANKEKIVRGMHNAFTKSMKSNIYDTTTLSEEITQHNENLKTLDKDLKDLNKSLEDEKTKQTGFNNQKLALVESKIKIDKQIISLDPTKLNQEIDVIVGKGVTYKTELDGLKKQIKTIGVINFDEDKDFKLTKKKNELSGNIIAKESEVTRLEGVIEDLISSGICQACNRALDDVDNTEHINNHTTQMNRCKVEIIQMKETLEGVNTELSKLSEAKALVDNKNKIELRCDRIEVEMDSLRNTLKTKKADLELYNKNIDAIDTNKNIDIEISLIDTNINVCEHQKNELSNKIQNTAISIDSNKRDIETKEGLIKTINKEEEVNKIFKLYVEMVGKKGISKLVLRSVLPIINSEIQRLLEDITDFDVEVFIDDKNDVRYLLIKDEVEKPLKSGSGYEKTASSIALRCVLGKMSTLPTPNFITFDEVLGRVAPENISGMKPLFEGISDMFDIVFFISQNDLVKDWGDKIITVIKENNVSRIKS